MALQAGQYGRGFADETTPVAGAGGSYPRFYTEAVQDNFQSKAQARPIFVEQEFVQVLMPGDKYNAPVFEVRDDHIERWPREYAAFKEGVAVAAIGTPVEHLPGISKAQVAALKALNIVTVEQLSTVPDTAHRAMGMGAVQLVETARSYLSAADNHAAAAQVKDLQAQLEEMRAMVEKLTAPQTEDTEQRRGPGRPRQSIAA